MSAIKTETILIAAGVLVLGALAIKFLPKVGGIFTGNNSLTQNATDASGNKTTAYQGAGVLGTAGAAVNAATGGAPASAGGWFGSKLFDLLDTNDYTSAPTNPAPPSTAAALDKYTQGGNASTGSGSIDTFTDPMTGYGFQWGQ